MCSQAAPRGVSDFRRGARVAVFVAALAYLFIVVRTAWLSDDAYISFRALDNFVQGRGLVWNVDERVQAFTNTLWVLLLAPVHTVLGDVYWTALGTAFVCAVLFVALLGRAIARGPWAAALALGVCASSKAFVEYSTSGLEGPLLHVLLALLVWVFLVRGGASAPRPRAPLVCALLFSAAFLTRPDATLLFGPPLAWEVLAAWRARRKPSAVGFGRVLAGVALGLLPVVLWELFSLWYYGFPLPNTAYAKLATGLPKDEVRAQGLAYFANSLRWDPVTLGAVAAGVLATLRLRSARAFVLVGAVALNLAYVVEIGGDFMSGRFLTPAFAVGVLLLARAVPERGVALSLLGLAAIGAAVSPRNPWRTPLTWGQSDATVVELHIRLDPTGVADERFVYMQYTSPFRDGIFIARAGLVHVREPHPFALRLAGAVDEKRIRWGGQAGFIPFWTGPSILFVDQMGLTDPLLARMPIYAGGRILYAINTRQTGHWRVGHYARDPLDGYVETLEAVDGRRPPTEAENQIEDPSMRAYYARLSEATRGDLGSWRRLRTIFELNTGVYDHLIDEHTERRVEEVRSAEAGPEGH